MGDLHSIAYSYSSNSVCLDIHNLPCFNTDISDYSCMETNKGSELMHDESVLDSDHDQSSGYLEDALFEFRSKRRRITLTHDDDDHDQGVMSSYQMNESGENNLSGENSSSCTDTTTTQSKWSVNNTNNRNLLSADKETLSSSDHIITAGGREEAERKKVRETKVVYPFVLVKPGGYKGDVTLNDINERILMPPTRPLRHPVGDFACRPLVSSLHTPGLSGKLVVALTRIQTHERGGTITIIRTKN